MHQKAEHSSITLGEILTILPGKGRSIVLILLCLPFIQPLQIPGLSTPFGLLIAFIGLRIAFGMHVWFPKRLLDKKISSHRVRQISHGAIKLVHKMKRWIHPRLELFCKSPYAHFVHGLFIFALGIFLSSPIPIPLSNFAPAWSIIFIALGILEDDGVFILLGYTLALVSMTYIILTTLTVEHEIFKVDWRHYFN